MVGDGDQALDVLVDDDHRHAAVAPLGERVPDLLANERREAFARFVEDQELRVGDEGAADRQHLLPKQPHATGPSADLGSTMSLCPGPPDRDGIGVGAPTGTTARTPTLRQLQLALRPWAGKLTGSAAAGCAV
jgi:hypothetical protein